MSDTEWRDMVVGDRMAVDEEFGRRVEESRFTRQEWGLVMTATEFQIEHPDDEERARIVADASSVSAVVPEFENLRGAGAIGASDGADETGGLLDAVKDALGLDDSGDASDEEVVAAAEELTQAYADALQARLEERGRWAEVRAAASESS